MEHKKLIRSTNAQINFLINYMSAHKNFANALYSGPMGARNMAEQWTYLRGLLKQHGPDKSVDQWKQTWRDIKRKARKQNADASARAAAEEIEHAPVVSASTIKVLDTIGHEISSEITPDFNVEIHPPASPVRETWRDVKRKPGKQNADTPARAAAEEIEHIPVVSAPTIKVEVDPIGHEIPSAITPECNVEIHRRESPVTEVKYVAVRRRRRRLPPEPVPRGDLLQAQNQRNALLQKLCDLVAEQNTILRERNQIERRKLYTRNRR